MNSDDDRQDGSRTLTTRQGHPVKFHWQPKQGVRNLTSAQAADIRAHDIDHATRDLHEAIARGTVRNGELCVQNLRRARPARAFRDRMFATSSP